MAAGAKVRNDDPVSLILDLLNSKPIGYDTVLRTAILCQVSSHSAREVLFCRANIHTHTHTHIVTK